MEKTHKKADFFTLMHSLAELNYRVLLKMNSHFSV